MSPIKRDNSLDSTLAFLSDGYTFISKRCERYDTDVFETRLMLQKVICARGKEASRMFYHPDRFTRRGAIPPTTLMLLQDQGSALTMDGEAHRHRKQMFMTLMSPASIEQLVNIMIEQWHQHLEKWVTMDQVILHNEVAAILCHSVCQWAGISLNESSAKQRTDDFLAMIDGAGSIGLRNLRGQLLRARTEQWMCEIIEAVRNKQFSVPEGSAVDVVASHQDLKGDLLDTKIAAVELINILRPTVAVAWYITFAALALYEHPECREKLLSGSSDYPELFIQEVRRFFPFFPAVGGHVKNQFNWRGYEFTPGTWVLLDLYGTNHDPQSWEASDTFEPERFRHWDKSMFNFIPQGGGDYHNNHRCPGEWITIELSKAALNLLTHAMQYDVPKQDLSINLSRIPAIPKSRFIISNVQRL